VYESGIGSAIERRKTKDIHKPTMIIPFSMVANVKNRRTEHCYFHTISKSNPQKYEDLIIDSFEKLKYTIVLKKSIFVIGWV